MMFNRSIRKCLTLLLLLAGSASVTAQPGAFHLLNKGREGQVFTVDEYLTKGKVNIVEFTSAACPSCAALGPKLEEMVGKGSGVVIHQMAIDRPGSVGIDWQSPLARQYELRSVPYFQVFDAAGKRIAEGEAARRMVAKLMIDAKVL